MLISSITSDKSGPQAHKRLALINTAAVSYSLVGYGLGLLGLLSSSTITNLLGLGLLLHSLLWSAYLVHDCMHGSLFRNRQLNDAVGNVLLWINGGICYSFAALKQQHIDHHVDRADILTFEVPSRIRALPVFCRWLVLAAEWSYIPVVAFWSRFNGLLRPWWDPDARSRRWQTVAIVTARILMFVGIGLLSPKAVALYLVAYIGMIHITRWADAFQHTYEGFPLGTDLPERSRSHEREHTFSTVLSCRYPWLNVLLLNFGYHSAHHNAMGRSWYKLPVLSRELYKQGSVSYMPVWEQLSNYHRYRVKRLLEGQGDVLRQHGACNYERFYGAVDVSFITLY